MSEDNHQADLTCCCASCGITEIDDIELKECDGCDLVRYCSDECQENHKSEHEEACKKRAADLRDELLFKQPESSHWGDCPICCLPLSLDQQKSIMMPCCSKIFCKGCVYADSMREVQQSLVPSCPFCREPVIITDEDKDKQRMKRIEANDPIALCHEGIVQRRKGDYRKAFEYWAKAAELGDAEAHFRLSILYQGEGVEQNKGKEIHHLEEAAIAGHPKARYNLGCYEYDNGNIERAVKHWMISATHAEDRSMKPLMDLFKEGYVSKEDLTSALRAYQTAVNATKSPQREAAEVFYRENHLR